MRRFVRTPPNVRVVAIGLAVLGHLVVPLLFVIERRMQRQQAAPEQLLFVSIWPDPEPPPRPPRSPPPRAAPTVRAITPVVTPREPAAIFTPEPSPQPLVPEPAAAPPINLAGAAQQAADLYMANHNKPDILSAVADSNGPRKPCRPPAISKAMQAKMDELLPRPADPGPPVTSPPGSVMMGGQRVGVLQFSGKPGGKSERIISPDEIRGERKSSVPDPFTCD